ncbi:MMPL family transporter [Phytohabitans rumicis]|uniref:Putative membrane protein n=1 Tax=Phytohabitans rumicis TaxID=1076125 RepID=A0A6V8L301_9ACTN|nr:MMPL family transporter [Phytohabitans rumicis]GFJ88487.1 putative membrane protein [Phytohabitans rumicis]
MRLYKARAGRPPASIDGVLAGAGRWCFRRPWLVIAIWLVAMVAGGVSAGPLFDRLVSRGPSELESVAAIDVLAGATGQGGQITGVVDGVDVRAAVVQAEVQATAAQLTSIDGVTAVVTPYEGGAPVTADGTALLVQVSLDRLEPAGLAAATDAVTRALREGERQLRAAGQAGARVQVGGTTAVTLQANEAIRTDLARGEALSLLLTAIALVVVFGGAVAAGLPVLVALVSVAAATGVLLAVAAATDLDVNAVTVTTLLGLGLAIDYSLLLLSRYREELSGPHPPPVALERTWATAGRTILFSALTVAASLVGMLAFGVPGISTLGLAGMAIAVVAMLASLTLTAALLGSLTRWIRPARHGVRRIAPPDGDDDTGFFARLARRVQRRPWLVALSTSAALIAAATPILPTAVRLDTVETLPRSIEGVQVADALVQRFGLPPVAAVTVVARTAPDALNTWAARWRQQGVVATVRPAAPLSAEMSIVEFDVRGDPQGDPVWRLIERIRADRPPGDRSWVTGDAAILRDLSALIVARLPRAVGLTALAMFVLLFLMTGSLVVPVKAIVMNVVSLAATFGVMSVVFYHGVFGSVLDTVTVRGFNPVFLVIIFGFAFGLSMDYEVFLLARVKEYVDAGVEPGTAVRWGLQQTGRMITSAALLMVIVLGCFAAARMSSVEQIGLGLAAAVAIDATLVRCLLVPATMTLLGRWNWWAPPVLTRLHKRFGLVEGGRLTRVPG